MYTIVLWVLGLAHNSVETLNNREEKTEMLEGALTPECAKPRQKKR